MKYKSDIKILLLNIGLWYPLNLLRSMPDIFRWIKSGCRCFAPHPIKMIVVNSYLKYYSMDIFVETGTYIGDTLGYIADSGVQCISIELSKELYGAACKRFRRYKNVRLIEGDSGKKLPEVLNTINKPALFWLDGHYSFGVTAKAETDTPVSIELNAILSHPIKKHVILIDDARCFDGTKNYPHLDNLLRVLRDDGNYIAEVSMDIIRLTPREVL